MGEGLALGRDAVRVGEVGRARFGHVLDRDDDLQVELLGDARIDDLALPLGADEEPSYPLQRPLRCGETDPLEQRGGSPEPPRCCSETLPDSLTRCSSRSSVSARCDPRFDWATAWISSTITASVVAKISRTPEESIR